MARWGGFSAASLESRVGQPARHRPKEITHDSQGHGRTEAITIARSHSQQEAPVTRHPVKDVVSIGVESPV
jgi:hypothetical protein